MCLCVFLRSEEDSEGNRDICSEILQMKALERLTSTVSLTFDAILLKSTFWILFLKLVMFLLNRYKVNWQWLSLVRLAKHVSKYTCFVNFSFGKNALEKFLMTLFLCDCFQYRRRTLMRRKRATRRCGLPVKRVARYVTPVHFQRTLFNRSFLL